MTTAGIKTFLGAPRQNQRTEYDPYARAFGDASTLGLPVPVERQKTKTKKFDPNGHNPVRTTSPKGLMR